MSTSVEPTTPSGLASRQLAEMLSEMGVVQEVTDGLSPEEAAAFIHQGWYAIDGEPQRSCCVIYHYSYEPLVLAHGLTMPAGVLWLDVWLAMESLDSPADEELVFANFHEAIAHEVNSVDGAGYAMTARLRGPAMRTHPSNAPQLDMSLAYWFAGYEVTWGPWRT